MVTKKSVNVELHEQLSVIEKKSQSERRRYSIKFLREVALVHRSTCRYKRKRDKHLKLVAVELYRQVIEVHHQSKDSADARMM